MKWYRKAADEGDATALWCVASLFYNGHGVLKDFSKALELARKSADRGSLAAQNLIGTLFEKGGHGLVQDYGKAMASYQKASEKGDAFAKCNIGCLFYYGRGQMPNEVDATKWFNTAAELDSEKVFEYGHNNLEINKNWPTDSVLGLKLIQIAAAKGNTNAKKWLIKNIDPSPSVLN